jgi:hypothetical protein
MKEIIQFIAYTEDNFANFFLFIKIIIIFDYFLQNNIIKMHIL